VRRAGSVAEVTRLRDACAMMRLLLSGLHWRYIYADACAHAAPPAVLLADHASVRHVASTRVRKSLHGGTWEVRI